MTVPQVFLNGAPFAQGRQELEQILARIDTGAEAKAAAKLADKEPFDVLVIGGGPAGAAAAIYAARKGIRTGIAAERFGGPRAEGRRVGEEGVSTCRSRGAPVP